MAIILDIYVILNLKGQEKTIEKAQFIYFTKNEGWGHLLEGVFYTRGYTVLRVTNVYMEAYEFNSIINSPLLFVVIKM